MNRMEIAVIAVVLPLAAVGLWAWFTDARGWWMNHQPTTRLGKSLRKAGLVVVGLLVVVVLVGTCWGMLGVG